MKIVFNEKTWHLICIWSFAGRFVLNLFEYIYHNVGHGGLEQSIQKQTEMGIVLENELWILYIKIANSMWSFVIFLVLVMEGPLVWFELSLC